MNRQQVTYPATLLCDFYKVSHREQYPKQTQKIYATWTPRTSRVHNVKKVVCFGLQKFIKEWLIDYFNKNFFNRPKEDVVAEYKRVIKNTIGGKIDTSHIEALHDLGYLPIKIEALKEGTLVPIRVPMLTITNTDDRFFWLTNYFETLMSAELWLPMTSATTALEYRKILQRYAVETGADVSSVPFQGHDFSMRGMAGVWASVLSGMGHILSFTGTDTIPAILAMEEFYNANMEEELIATSIPATEHSVQCAGGKEDEFKTYERLIKEVYPNGFCSIVSDTWDFWNVVTNFLPRLKDDIMKRDGRVVIRPDSGNPVDIICGSVQVYDMDKEKYVNTLEDAKDHMKELLIEKVTEDTPHNSIGETNPRGYFKFENTIYLMELDICYHRYDGQHYMEVSISSCEETQLSAEQKGLIECLWEIFGGTITEKGYKQLDSHIGAIYGDAITLERCGQICERLKEKGFTTTNVVYGIGSFTYQYVTRDTFGFALKTTYAIIDEEERLLFKDPVTDDGTKKSQRGLVAVQEGLDGLTFIDGLLEADMQNVENLLQPVFENGVLLKDYTLKQIRKEIAKNF